jgi:hypothetical protein
MLQRHGFFVCCTWFKEYPIPSIQVTQIELGEETEIRIVGRATFDDYMEQFSYSGVDLDTFQGVPTPGIRDAKFWKAVAE